MAQNAQSLNRNLPDEVIIDRVDLKEDYLVGSPPIELLNQFTIENGRYIVDGPRSPKDDSIDYSDLVNNDAIYRTFMNSAFGGGELNLTKLGWHSPRKSSYTGDTLVKLPSEIDVVSKGLPSPIPNDVLSTQILVQNRISSVTGVEFTNREETVEGNFTILNLFPQSNRHALELSGALHRHADQSPDGENIGLRRLAELLRLFSIHNLHCIGSPAFDKNKKPVSVLIIIKTGSYPGAECIFEELVQIMGLFRDDDSSVGTLFTDSYKYYKRPTRADWLMLKVLYDPRLKNGMSRAEVGPIVKKILAELRPYGEAAPASG